MIVYFIVNRVIEEANNITANLFNAL